MQLNSSDGASVELRIPGYEFPDYPAPAPDRALSGLKGPGNTPVPDVRTWDANWLQVAGNVTLADGRTWAFEDPCLTTWEARELGEWLREVSAGTERPFRGIREPQGWLVFTNPNLGLTLQERTVGHVWMRIEFTGETKPPLTHTGPDSCPGVPRRLRRGSGRGSRVLDAEPGHVSRAPVTTAADARMGHLHRSSAPRRHAQATPNRRYACQEKCCCSGSVVDA